MGIFQATEEDIAIIRELLSANGLPLEGFPQDCAVIMALKSQQDTLGGVALEIHGNYGLLRSLVVEAHHRGLGFGERLLKAALHDAASRKLSSVYLLTETAERYFARFGFQPVHRQRIPPPLQHSVEFRGACPDTALAMMLTLWVAPQSGE